MSVETEHLLAHCMNTLLPWFPADPIAKAVGPWAHAQLEGQHHVMVVRKHNVEVLLIPSSSLQNTAIDPALGASGAVASRSSEKEGRLLQELGELQSEVKALSEEKASLQQQLDSSSSTVAILQDEKSKLQQEVAEAKKEQDDLLVLLADQDQKLSALRSKLKDLGMPVEDEDDIESGDQADEDEDGDEEEQD